MFITNGKSLFGNTGLIISLLILIILVYFSYNKCYVNKIDSFGTMNNFGSMDTFGSTDPPSRTSTSNSHSPKVRIKISGGTVAVNFTIDISAKIPNSFIVVLGQYDINKNNTGNNKFYLSNETILNPSLSSKPTAQSAKTSSLQGSSQNNLCNIVNGKPQCQYIFSNLDVKDSSGNLYYYKVGVAALYDNNTNSAYATPYNISNINKMFTLNESVDNQNSQSNCNKPPISANTYGDTISTVDGRYELIKSQLGNYPDNLLLQSQTTTDSTLSDLVDKSMSQALLNVNVTANLPSFTESNITIPNNF